MRSIKKLVYAEINRRYLPGCSNYNTLEVRKRCRSKKQGREVFAQHNVPHARGGVFISPLAAHRFAKQHGFPLCVKPNVSGFSRGSYFPINNYRDLWRSFFKTKVWWPATVVEEYLLGSNYRVLATPDRIVSVIRRYPPFVDGNGKDDIDTLIDRENDTREHMQLYPVIHPIEKNSATLSYLKKQNLTLSSVPADGERVYTFNRVALAPGGVIETIDRQTLPKANEELFKSIVSMFGARLLGIDVIFEHGIEQPFTDQKCICLEVNTRPYISMHEVPRYGKKDNLDAFFAEMDALVVDDPDIF